MRLDGSLAVHRPSADNVLWNSFKRISTELFGEGPSKEKDALFYGTAARAYRLDLPGATAARAASATSAAPSDSANI